jgi:2-polyprenyl-3-methyl-5-hydroxy-6-metoxy-1,4-benzoquinol methylase
VLHSVRVLQWKPSFSVRVPELLIFKLTVFDVPMDFTIRSYKLEMLDQPDIPFADIKRNMYELSVINHKLGGHAITWRGFVELAGRADQLHVCEIGCGGGDNLKAIEDRVRNKKPVLQLIGIDINADCVGVAKNLPWKNQVKFLVSDYRNVYFQRKPDIIFCSLFCHHFKDDELINMFQWMKINSQAGFFINDLHRHPLAYYSIRFLTGIFSRSYLVKNDAPLSVLRGFKKKELETLLRKAGISDYIIQWKWAFRWLVIVPS